MHYIHPSAYTIINTFRSSHQCIFMARHSPANTAAHCTALRLISIPPSPPPPPRSFLPSHRLRLPFAAKQIIYVRNRYPLPLALAQKVYDCTTLHCASLISIPISPPSIPPSLPPSFLHIDPVRLRLRPKTNHLCMSEVSIRWLWLGGCVGVGGGGEAYNTGKEREREGM